MTGIDLTIEFAEAEEGVYISVNVGPGSMLLGFISSHAIKHDPLLQQKTKEFFEAHVKRAMAREGIKHAYTLDEEKEAKLDKSKFN